MVSIIASLCAPPLSSPLCSCVCVCVFMYPWWCAESFDDCHLHAVDDFFRAMRSVGFQSIHVYVGQPYLDLV